VFLPTTREELIKLGWTKLDIILVTGDTYIDSSNCGVAVIGQVLLARGYKVGIIAQPECQSATDICRLGEPRLFWGITSGAVDSQVANYTATGKKRRQDDLTPGGINNRRPDRALIVYTNLIRRYFKKTVPIILGGLEASLRRIAHYDYWKDKICRALLFDAKADYLIYGMGEKAVIELAAAFAQAQSGGNQPAALSEQIRQNIKGLCYISKTAPKQYRELPAYEEVLANPDMFTVMFKLFYRHTDPLSASGLFQRHGDRYLVQNPPQPDLSTAELDTIYNLPYARSAHPYYKQMGVIRALDTIQFSITTHRGCFGECNFCAITVHQGRRILSRSPASILQEVRDCTQHPDFKGIISDLGGPTANMYAMNCPRWLKQGPCEHKRCLFPAPCTGLSCDHRPQLNLLRQVRSLPGVKKVFVASGLRYDLLMADKQSQAAYLNELVQYHISGQLKIAPEHSVPQVLRLMGKESTASLMAFKQAFDALNKKQHKRQFLTYYFLVAHPGCDLTAMDALKDFIKRQLQLQPEQVQIFTPTPSTYSTLMYYTGKNPFTGKQIVVERRLKEKIKQKERIIPRRRAVSK
jgi:uncharacterized radical SAM protein YgiQ